MATLLHRHTPSSGHGVGARMVRNAWISVAMFLVSFVIATVLGDAIITASGYEPGADDVPWLDALTAGVPAVLVLIAPGFAAWYFGRRAIRYGDERGRRPMVVGLVLAAFGVVMNVAAFVAGQFG
jgi:hypothetical protein